MRLSFATPEEVRNALGFDDWPIRRVSYLLMAMGIPLTFIKDWGSFSLIHYFASVVVSLVHTVILWEGNRQIFIALRNRFTGIKQVWARLRIQLVLMLIYSLGVGGLLHVLIYGFTEHYSPNEDYSLSDALWLALLLPTMIGTFYECAYFFQRWRASVVETERIKLHHVQTQLESLKHQVNPHFLFNSLNTLTSLIPQDPEQAVVFVQRLSQVYRYVLEVNAGRTIPLHRELTFIQAYLFLLEARHGDRLHVSIEVPEAYHQKQIVPLALQILIENAVKHNVASHRRPLEIQIEASPLGLTVRNPLQRKRVAPQSTGMGLHNLRERYRLLEQEDAIVVQEGPDWFEVKLPFLSLPSRAEAL